MTTFFFLTLYAAPTNALHGLLCMEELREAHRRLGTRSNSTDEEVRVIWRHWHFVFRVGVRGGKEGEQRDEQAESSRLVQICVTCLCPLLRPRTGACKRSTESKNVV